MAFDGAGVEPVIAGQDVASVALVFMSTLVVTYYIIERHLAPKNGLTSKGKRLPYPPSIGSLPFIGSIPYLPRSFDDFHKFCLEKTYSLGGVFSMKVGDKFVVLLTTHETIHDAFVTKAAHFSHRPGNQFFKIGNPKLLGIIARSYDVVCKKFQKLSLTALKEFGFGQNLMELRINHEAEELIASIKKQKGQAFNPKDTIFTATENVIAGVLFGQRVNDLKNDTKKLFDANIKATDIALGLIPLDVVPSLRFLPHFHRIITELQCLNDEIFQLTDRKIDELLSSGKTDNFVSFYVAQEGNEFDREQLIWTLRDLVAAGSDTTSNTMLWALVLLANNPSVQQHIQKEIDDAVPRDRLPSLADKSKLPYVEAAILEVLRRKPLAQNGLPHMTSCDTDVCGYFVPKSTMVMNIIYASHMNVNVWEDPNEFRPERFLDAAGNVIDQDKMIAFSVGKRSCLGELLARQELFLFFTALLQQFDIRPPEGHTLVDCHEETKSLLVPSPFKVRLLPRD